MAAKIYEVEAAPEGRWWVLTVESLGIAGQVRRLDEAEEVARSLVAVFLNIDETDVDVHVTVRLPQEVMDMLTRAEADESNARQTLEAAGAQRRHAIVSLLASGMTQREIARALKISPQRVSQLMAEEKKVKEKKAEESISNQMLMVNYINKYY
jgi:DNA-binding CsgD family transcriptional regulator